MLKVTMQNRIALEHGKYLNKFSLIKFFFIKLFSKTVSTHCFLQAFVKEASNFSGRPNAGFIFQYTEGLGVAFADYGEHWKTQRKFGLTTLRGYVLRNDVHE